MADTISKVKILFFFHIFQTAFDMFLGVKGEIEDFKEEEGRNCSFNISILDNPLNDFVELPEHLLNLDYSNIICGVIRGALSTV